MIATEKTIGLPNRQAGRQHDAAHVAADRVASELLAQSVHHVLGHHDRRIDKHADRDRDTGERHRVRLDVDQARLFAMSP